MMKILNVAEKNDAAKSLSKIMSKATNSFRPTSAKFNKIYQFNYNLHGRNVQMLMTSVSGHLSSIDFKGEAKKWHMCNPRDLFHNPIELYYNEYNSILKNMLQREVKLCSQLIIWTNCDREGEHIGNEIVNVCLQANPRIVIKRARFSEITARAVESAINNLTNINKDMVDAVDCRTELDLRIGSAFTRLQTMELKKTIPALKDNLISYGPCQFPTLGFVVRRYKEIQNFISEPFWSIHVSKKWEENEIVFNWKRGRVFDKNICTVFFDQCNEKKEVLIKTVDRKPTSKKRPVALDTVEMEKLACNRLKLSAKQVMTLAEKLYGAGFISYPRTETNQFAEGMDLQGSVQKQINEPLWKDFTKKLLETGITPRNGNKTDKAHPPIHPIKSGESLEGDQRKLYELITRHFLACLSSDAKGFETQVTAEVNSEQFTVSGLIITERNYLDVYPYHKWNAKELPKFEPNTFFIPDAIKITEGKTTPPPLLSESDLIALMEKHGIGTDATHCDHIEKIKNRSYIGLNENMRLLPGKLGMALVDGYSNIGIEMALPNKRAQLERQLEMISSGRLNKTDVLNEQVAIFEEVYDMVNAKFTQLKYSVKTYFSDED